MGSNLDDIGVGGAVNEISRFAAGFGEDSIKAKVQELEPQDLNSEDEGPKGGDGGAGAVEKPGGGGAQHKHKIGLSTEAKTEQGDSEVSRPAGVFRSPSRQPLVGEGVSGKGDASAAATGLHWSLLPDCGLENYTKHCFPFYHINTNIKGLRVVSEDPYVLIMPGLLNRSQCEALIKKAEGNWVRSKMRVSSTKVDYNESRTSTEVLLHPVETPYVHESFAKVLGCPVSDLAPTKVIRYEKGQRFKTHHDGNKKAVMFVYLNSVGSGGATSFDRLSFVREGERFPLIVQPEQGLAVIHFPATMSSRLEAKEWDHRTRHSGLPAESTKFLCFQGLPCQRPDRTELAQMKRHGRTKV